MTDHFPPKPVQRFNFHSYIRNHGEPVAIFVAELKKLSEHCGFGDSLNDALHDRLICGINDGRIQRRLLAESDLTYKKSIRDCPSDGSSEMKCSRLRVLEVRKLHHVKITGTTPVTSRKPQFSACYTC